MPRGKCPDYECDFVFDDAEHGEDAMAKIRAHFRTEHKTKMFHIVQREFERSFELLNLTGDEALHNYLGERWETLDDHTVTNGCRAIFRNREYGEEARTRCQEISAERGVELVADEATTLASPYTELAAPSAIARGLSSSPARDYGPLLPPNPYPMDSVDEGPEEPF